MEYQTIQNNIHNIATSWARIDQYCFLTSTQIPIAKRQYSLFKDTSGTYILPMYMMQIAKNVNLVASSIFDLQLLCWIPKNHTHNGRDWSSVIFFLLCIKILYFYNTYYKLASHEVSFVTERHYPKKSLQKFRNYFY